MSKRGRTEDEGKCKGVIKGSRRKKKMVVRLHRIVTVPHCYPSVVLNTLETSIEVGIGVEVKFIVTGKGTRVAVGGGTEINHTPRTEVTSIVTGNTGAMGLDTVFEMMGGATGSVSLIDFREAMSMRRRDVNMWSMGRSRSRDRGKTGTGSYARTSSRSVAMTTFMTPFTTVVA